MVQVGSGRQFEIDSEDPRQNRRHTLKPGQMSGYAFTNSDWQSSG